MFQAETEKWEISMENIRWVSKDQDTKQHDPSNPTRGGLSITGGGDEGAFCWDYIEDYTAHLIALCLAVYMLGCLANYNREINYFIILLILE